MSATSESTVPVNAKVHSLLQSEKGHFVTASSRDPDGYLVEVMYHFNRSW